MYYFAYGSNMNSERMKQRRVDFLSKKSAKLNGYRLVFNKVATRNPKEGYANIIPDKDGVVEGVLYEINNSDIEKLDKCEVYPKHYGRDEVAVWSDEKKVVAVTYIAQKDKMKEGLLPSKDYMQNLLSGKDMISKPYYERLKSWPTLD